MHEILCAWHPKFKQDQKEIAWSTHAVQIDYLFLYEMQDWAEMG